MTFVKTKLKLELLEEGDILEVLLKAGEPLENVPSVVVNCIGVPAASAIPY